MGPCDDAKFGRSLDANELREIVDVVLVGFAGFFGTDIGKPFEFRWHVGQLLKLFRGQCAFGLFEQQVGHSDLYLIYRGAIEAVFLGWF